MRLLPRTLYGRMVAVLFVGLVSAQLLSAGLLLRDRGQAIYRAMGHNAVERVVSAVHLLNAIPASLRAEALPALGSSEMRVSIADALVDSPADADDSGAAPLHGQLRRAFGSGVEFRLRTGTDAAALPAAMGPMHDMMGGAGSPMRGPWALMHGVHAMARMLDVQVQLQDGSWVVFQRELPAELFDWPQRVLLLLGFLLASVLLVAWVAVRWVTRPLRVLAGAAEELGRDIGRPPLPVGGPDEVAHAARAFNTMQRRLSRYLEDRSRILAAVSHDLKTPITRLRLRSELIEDPDLARDVRQDLDEMEAMVVATLEFMRGAHSEEPSQPIDVESVIESLVEDLQAPGQTIAHSGGTARPYLGKPLALKRCLSNLIENAVRYGERVQIEVDDQPDRLRIRVTDEGPGIPEAEMAKVFEPFYRLEGSRNQHTGGTGLGLGIARNLARAQGGDLTLRNRPGKGLEAVVDLPR